MTAVIVSNGSIKDYTFYKRIFAKADFVVGVDGGATHLRKLGVKPNLLLGDFDSIDPKDLEFFRRQEVEILEFPPQKDMTDTELAMETLINKGYKTIYFIGGLGSRFDHSISNVFTLKKLLEKNIEGIIVNETNQIRMIQDKISLTKEEGWKVTLLALSEEVEGVTTQGLRYPLHNATLRIGSSLGVSNEFAADRAEVIVKKGVLLVLLSKDE